MAKIPGCSSAQNLGGNSLDDNTVSEGTCTLDGGNGGSLSIYVWAAGDTSDLEQYVYFSGGEGCCLVGAKPQPWAISLDNGYASSFVSSEWATVEGALNGQMVTNAPASWSDGSGSMTVSQSSSPSPSPLRIRHHHHRVRHHRRAHHMVAPPPAATPTPSHASGAWCSADAVFNSQYNDYDVYVHSNQPNQDVTASASNGESMNYYTNSSGYADVYLYADSGDSITVQVGNATCSTSA